MIWDEEQLRSYIDNFVEEAQMLEYKAADALKRTDGQMNEITKGQAILTSLFSHRSLQLPPTFRLPIKK